MKKTRTSVLLALTVLLMLSACGEDSFLNRRDMGDDSNNDTPVDRRALCTFHIDWTTRFSGNPTGMTMTLFGDSSGRQEIVSNDVNPYTMRLDNDRYRILVHNLTATELASSLTFRNEDSFDGTTVTVNPLTGHQRAQWEGNTEYVSEVPDIGYAADTIQVSNPDSLNPSHDYRLTVQSFVTRLDIRLRIEGIQNLRAAAGIITGMTTGLRARDLEGIGDTAAYYLGHWEKEQDAGDETKGWLTTSGATFGLPGQAGDLAARDSTLNTLRLICRLRDSSLRIFNLRVGNLFSADRTLTRAADGHIRLQLNLAVGTTLPDGRQSDPIVLPDVKDDGTESGFTAEVGNWDDGGNTEARF